MEYYATIYNGMDFSYHVVLKDFVNKHLLGCDFYNILILF